MQCELFIILFEEENMRAVEYIDEELKVEKYKDINSHVLRRYSRHNPQSLKNVTTGYTTPSVRNVIISQAQFNIASNPDTSPTSYNIYWHSLLLIPCLVYCCVYTPPR